MANRYWVGGTGAWDATAGTKWATTSGGAGGASVPTLVDDVFFDANSGSGTVSLAGGQTVLNLNTTGFTGSIDFGNQNIQIYGGITIGATTTLVNSSNVYLPIIGNNPSTGTFSIDLNGKTVAGLNFTGNGGGGKTYNFLSNFNIYASVWGLIHGNDSTLNFNSITVGAAGGVSTPFYYNFNGTGNVNFGSATFQGLPSNPAQFSFSSSGTFSSTNLTLSNFNSITSNKGTIQSATLVKQDTPSYPEYKSIVSVSLQSASASIQTLTWDISGSGKFPELSLSASASQNINTLSISSGTSASKRPLIRSSSGTQVPLVVNSVSGMSYVDFYNVSVTGSAAPITGTALGNYGSTSGITFPSTVTRYAVAAGNFSSTSMWSASSGGAAGASVPLPHDTATFDLNSPAGTYNFDVNRIGEVNCAVGFSRNLTTSGQPILFSGNFTLRGSTSTFQMYTDPIASRTFSLNGISIDRFFTVSSTSASQVNATYGYLENSSTLTSSTTFGSCNLRSCTISNLTSGSISLDSTSTAIGTLYLSGTLSGGGYGSITSLILNSGTVTINSATGTSIGTISNTPGSPFTLSFGSGKTYSITNFNVNGASGALGTLTSTSTTNATLSYTGATFVSVNYLNVSKITGSPANKWYVGSNSIDGGSNINVYFSSGIQTAKGLFFGSNF